MPLVPESLADFFLQHFQARRHERAYGHRSGYRMSWFTYSEVFDSALRFSRELVHREISKGDRVMLWGTNCAEWVAAFYGCAISGAVAVPMDDGASITFAARICEQVGAKLVVCSRRHAREIAARGIAVPILTLEELPQQLACHPPSPRTKTAISRNDTLQIVFTSGTTADPKGVVITHGNVLANISPFESEMHPYLKYERLVHPIRFLNLLPLSHVFGQFLAMFLPPLLGGTVVFQDDLKPSEIMNTIRRERISVLACVPRVLQSMKQRIERDLPEENRLHDFRQRWAASQGRHFLRRWWIFRRIRRKFGWKFWAFISGGATLDHETEEFWGRLGYAAIQGYGLTETTSLVSVNHPFKLGKGSIGKVLAGRDVKLADDGEILVRGAGVTSGYWDTAELHKTVAPDGWYHTGDIGALDEAGNLYFKGRKKEVIVTPAGLNIYPDDLEAALLQQPDVKDCVVVGIERGGNAEPCAVLLLQSDASPDAVVALANQSLSEYQRMHMSLEWPGQDFPRTNTQKPRRNVIQEFARRQILKREAAPRGANPLAEFIQQLTGRPAARLNSDATLDADLGLSSLDRVELLSALEDRYQLDLSETRFSSARTVGDLERMLRGEAATPPPFHYPRWTLRWPVTWIRLLAHYLLTRPAIILLGWPRIEGREHLRGSNGPLLVVCNHVGDVDAGFIQFALPARFRHRLATATGGEALEALRTPPPGRGFFTRLYDRAEWILGVSLLNLFPLPREAGFRQSFAYAGQAADRAYNILVFPEGRHTLNGKLSPFRAGIGLLAQNLRVPVLPMRIDGLFEFKNAGKKFAPPGKICVRIGKPIRFPEDADPAQIAHQLQDAVQNL